MKTIGFIGAYDKIDLIIYTAGVLTQMGKKVMIIDSTILQKSKYIIPAISPSTTYVTSFSGIDVAIGFNNYLDIKSYLGMPGHASFEYDYIFIDIDTAQALNDFEINVAYKNYFVTGFDVYSLKRGLEIVKGAQAPIQLKKILFSKDMTKEEDDYLNYLALGSKAIWEEERIYFPIEQGDQIVIAENQRVEKIKLKKLTQFYKESLMYLLQELVEEQDLNDLRKTFKQMEKGV